MWDTAKHGEPKQSIRRGLRMPLLFAKSCSKYRIDFLEAVKFEMMK